MFATALICFPGLVHHYSTQLSGAAGQYLQRRDPQSQVNHQPAFRQTTGLSESWSEA